MRAIFAAVAVLVLVGCASVRTVNISAPFEPALAEALLKPGTNTIKGSALIRQQGGGVVTCAGNPVVLIPATPYAKQRVDGIFGSGRYSPPLYGVTFSPDPPLYNQLTRSSTCNAQGFFTFDRVGDGDFFVATKVIWMVRYNEQGGNLLARVTVKGGETVEVTLTP